MKRGENGAKDVHAELLRAIWNEIKALGQNLGGRIDSTNARLDQTNARLEAVRTELKEQIEELRDVMVSSDMKLATAVTQLAAETKHYHQTTKAWYDEQKGLRRRVERIEEKIGLSPRR